MAGHCSAAEMASIYNVALFETAWKGSSQIAHYLLQTTSFESKTLSEAFELSCVSGHSNSVSSMLRQDSDRAIGYEEFSRGLITASGYGHGDVVHLILRELAGNDSLQSTIDRALNLASLSGHVQTVNILLQEGADPDVLVKEVLANQGEQEPNNSTSLVTPQNQHSGVMRTALEAALQGYLISENCQISPVSFATGRHMADKAAWEAIILLLLEYGADINKSYSSPVALIQAAVEYCSPRVVQSIIDHAASVKDLFPSLFFDVIDTTSFPFVLKDDSLKSKSLLEVAAGRERLTASILKILFEAGAQLPKSDSDSKRILNSALR